MDGSGTSSNEHVMDELTTTYEWRTLPWRQLERRVFKLQKRIYQASQRGDVKTVRRLQRLMMNSWSAKCLAVRRVTQDNQGSAARWRAEEKSESVTPVHERVNREGWQHSKPR